MNGKLLKILTIETSSADIEFAFVENDAILHEKKLNRESNADSLIYIIREDFKAKGLQFSDIDVVSFSAGPGSFTGLRIGLAVAKGICYAAGCKLVMIPTLDIIANKAAAKIGRTIVPLIYSNMRSAEFYFAEYIKEDGSLKRTSDYGIKKLDEIGRNGKDLLINGSVEGIEGITGVSDISGVRSQLELTLKYISEDKFSDVSTSEPFYLKDFEPVKAGV